MFHRLFHCTPPVKHLGFIKLMEAMRAGGCPICFCIADSRRQSIEGFLYERVNDGGVRARMRADNGLCHRHLWILAGCGDSVGGSLVIQDFLENARREFGERPPAPGLLRRFWQLGRQVCFFCRDEKTAYELALRQLVAYAGDPELDAAWRTATLCIPHLAAVTESLAAGPAKDRLWTLHTRKYAQLDLQLRELIKTFNYPCAQSPGEAVRNCWLRGAAVLAGERALGAAPAAIGGGDACPR